MAKRSISGASTQQGGNKTLEESIRREGRRVQAVWRNACFEGEARQEGAQSACISACVCVCDFLRHAQRTTSRSVASRTVWNACEAVRGNTGGLVEWSMPTSKFATCRQLSKGWGLYQSAQECIKADHACVKLSDLRSHSLVRQMSPNSYSTSRGQ